VKYVRQIEMLVFVRTGSKTISVTVNTSDTIQAVKLKIQQREGIPPDEQRLLFKGIVLNDSDSLKSDCQFVPSAPFTQRVLVLQTKGTVHAQSPEKQDDSASSTNKKKTVTVVYPKNSSVVKMMNKKWKPPDLLPLPHAGEQNSLIVQNNFFVIHTQHTNTNTNAHTCMHTNRTHTRTMLWNMQLLILRTGMLYTCHRPILEYFELDWRIG